MAALLLIERLPDGRYPERLDDQAYALAMVEYLRTTMIRRALDDDRPVVATISEPADGPRHTALGALFGGQAKQEVLDPGLDIIVERLAGPDGQLSQQCTDAVERWYGAGAVAERVGQRRPRRRRVI